MAKNKNKKPTKQSRRRRRPKSTAAVPFNRGLVKYYKGVRVISTKIQPSDVGSAPFDLNFATVGRLYDLQVLTYTMSAKVQVTGLATVFNLQPKILMGQCPYATTTPGSSENFSLINVATNYAECRLVDFHITAKNAGSSTTHGLWSLSFWPMQSRDSAKSFERYYTVAGARNAPLHIEGQASKTLSLSHKFTIANPYAFQVGGFDKCYGIVSIIYSEPTRSTTGTINATEFDPIITVSGTLMLTTKSQRPNTFDNSVQQIDLPGVCGIGHDHHAFENKGLIVRPAVGTDSTFEGKPWTSTPVLSLDDMAID